MRFVSSQLPDSHFIPGPIISSKKISLQQQLRTTCSFREPGNKANCGCSTISSRESFMFSLFRLSTSAFSESIATIVQKFQTSLHAIVCFAGAATYIEINTWARVDMKFLFELNTRIEIPYLQATMYYFVYHIKNIALYWKEKPTSLMNENKWIDNPRVTIVGCVSANPSDGKMRRIMITKTNGRNFQFSKFSFIEFVLIDRRSLSGKWPKSARGKSSSCRFSFSAERNVNTKAAEYLTFGFSFSILFSSPSRKVWASLSVSDTDFFCVLAAIIWGFSRQTACIENREGFAVHSPAWPSDAKGEWLFSSWLAISTRVKKNDIFSVCCYGFSQGWKFLYNTTVYVINNNNCLLESEIAHDSWGKQGKFF